MNLVLVNLYPSETIARYLLSSYVLKAYLQKYCADAQELAVQVLNFSYKTSTARICEKIIQSAPDWIGYSCYIWNIEKVSEVIKALQGRVRVPHILGGPEISLSRASYLLQNKIGDYYVIGEGEKKLADLINYFIANAKGFPREFPRGIAYQKENIGELSYAPDETVVDLEEIPSVYLSGVIEDKLYERQEAFLETQRGCKFRCAYCVYHKGLPKISYYPLHRITAELEHLIVKKRVSALRFFDAQFSSDLARAKAIVRYLRNLKAMEGVRLPWLYWEFVFNGVDDEFIELTASLKYREMIRNSEGILPLDRPQIYSDFLEDYSVINCIGIQSFSKAALGSVKRAPVVKERFDLFMTKVMKHNVVLKVDMILGLPFETVNSYFAGIEFILPYFRNTDHILNIHNLQVLPGSDLEKESQLYNIRYSLGAPHAVFATNTMSESELIEASRLTAVLLRVVNSPLRKYFFSAMDRSGESAVAITRKLLNAVSQDFKDSSVAQTTLVEDSYWNNKIFHEVPSKWLISFLQRF